MNFSSYQTLGKLYFQIQMETGGTVSRLSMLSDNVSIAEFKSTVEGYQCQKLLQQKFSGILVNACGLCFKIVGLRPV